MAYFIAGREVVLGDVEGRMGWVFKDTSEAVTINDTEKEKASEATDTTQEDQGGGQLVQRGDRGSDA
jgi:hypothetical protein